MIAGLEAAGREDIVAAVEGVGVEVTEPRKSNGRRDCTGQLAPELTRMVPEVALLQ